VCLRRYGLRSGAEPGTVTSVRNTSEVLTLKKAVWWVLAGLIVVGCGGEGSGLTGGSTSGTTSGTTSGSTSGST